MGFLPERDRQRVKTPTANNGLLIALSGWTGWHHHSFAGAYRKVFMTRWNSFIGMTLLLMVPHIARAQDAGQRWELGGLITYTFLKEIGTRDVGSGTESGGLGGRLVYRALPFLDLESEINFLPGNSATSGNHLQGFFGAKAGKRWKKGGIFLKARPGFIHFSRDQFGVKKPGSSLFSTERATSTEPDLDLGGVIEYYTARGLILRFDLGDSVIHYARRTVRTSDGLPPIEAGGFTTHNWQGSFGISFRF